MKQSVLEYKKLLEQEGLLVEFAEPEGKEREDRPVTLVTYFSGGADQGTLFLCKGAAFKAAYLKDAVNRGAVAYVSEKNTKREKKFRRSSSTMPEKHSLCWVRRFTIIRQSRCMSRR